MVHYSNSSLGGALKSLIQVRGDSTISSYSMPPIADCLPEQRSEEHGDRVYWVNKRTGQSQWDRPGDWM